MRDVNMDVVLYQEKIPYKSIQKMDREKKRKFLEASLNQRLQLPPFCVLAEALIFIE